MIRFTKAKRQLIKPRQQSIKKQNALQKLNSFLTQQEPEAVEFLYRDLEGLQNTITYKELREAYLAGGITDAEFEAWQTAYAEMVTNDLKPKWELAAAQAADEMRDRYPEFLYEPGIGASIDWINNHGAALVTNLAQEQKGAINAIISHVSGYTAVTPDEAARIIRPTIGLTIPQAMANARYREKVLEAYKEAHPHGRIETAERKASEMAAKYGARQHRYRAQMIARTELVYGYNAGHYGATKDAMAQGYIGDCTKTWLTAYDERVCPECSHMDGEAVNIDDFFSNGVDLPPAHPQCRCAVAYEEIPWTEPDFIQGVVGNEYAGKQVDYYLTDPARLGDNTPEEKYNDFMMHGVDVKPLGRGNLDGLAFADGGGYRVGDGGNKYFQYHPAKGSHHGGAYYKMSKANTPTSWYDMDGNEIITKAKRATTAAFQDAVFDGLGFERYEIGAASGICYKGPDGYLYTITDFGKGEYVIEYAETEEAAEKNCFWDADWFDGDPDTVIPQMRDALAGYIAA